MNTSQIQFDKDRASLKYFLLGRNYHESLIALGIAASVHVGTRKDKVTPAFQHQVSVCFNFQNVPIDYLSSDDEQSGYTALLLHDTVEDTEITCEDLTKADISNKAIELIVGMTKTNMSTVQYYENMLSHWMIPILKACDRDNNLMTMQGVFSPTKITAYLEETETYVLPMLKKSGYKYPQYHRSYKALASGLKKQIYIYKAFTK